jgi:hypothetical protein
MDENRQFFRIKNTGRIVAKIANVPLEIVDISATGALIKKMIRLQNREYSN